MHNRVTEFSVGHQPATTLLFLDLELAVTKIYDTMLRQMRS